MPKLRITLLPIPLAVIACAIDTTEDQYSEVAQNGLVSSSTIWPWRSLTVCSERYDVSTEMEWTRDIVERTWGAETGIQFRWRVDGATCAQIGGAINMHVMIDDASTSIECGEGSALVGTYMNNVTNGIHLPRCRNLALNDQRRQIQSTAVHEFGHALSFIHEQARLDSTCTNYPDSNSPGIGDTPVGPYDPVSVMSYCQPVNYWRRLSNGDAWAGSNYYGDALPFAFMKYSSSSQELFARLNGPNAPSTAGGNVHVRPYAGSLGWNTSWSDLGNDGQPPTSAPAAAYDGTRRHLFVRSATGTVSYNTVTNGAWTGWSSLGTQQVIGRPVAISPAPNRVVLLAKNTNWGLSIMEFDGSQWLPWQTIPNPTVPAGDPAELQNLDGTPSAVVGQDGSVHVFVRWSDGSIRTISRTATGSWPSSWTNLGGSAIGLPSVVAWKNAGNALRLVVFVRTTTSRIVYRMLNAGTWGGWVTLADTPTGVSGYIAVVSRTNDLIDIVFREPVDGKIIRTALLWVTTTTRNGPISWQLWSGSWEIAPFLGGTSGSPMAFDGGIHLEVFAATDNYDHEIQRHGYSYGGSQWSSSSLWTGSSLY